jgi:NitT/TauT family transport system substrate-binding protein
MPTTRTPLRRSLSLLAVVPAAALLAACGGTSDAASGESSGGAADELRLGYFANVTHAAALIGVNEGLVEGELGDTTLTTQVFNAGPDEVEALFAGALDAAYIGPSPTINAYGQSDGDAIRIIAGAASGGAQLVVREGIDSADDLKGTTLASPQLGNTQDVALKKWLQEQGISDKVQVTNLENSQTLDSFKKGDVQAAWLPEPWSSRLVLEAGATVLLDEKELWPGGTFPTTVLIVRTAFLNDHPKTVQALLRGLVASIDFAGANKTEAQAAVNKQLKELTGKDLSQPVTERAWSGIELTLDPIAGQFPQLAKDAVTAGVAKEAANVAGYADLTALNVVLKQLGKSEVDPSGLDKK